MALFSDREVVGSATRSASGESAKIDVPSGARKISLAVDVTAVSGTPTLDLSIEWTTDGSTWFAGQPADSFSQITAATKVTKIFDVKASAYRVKWTIGGTTSFTFAVDEFAS